MSYFVDEHELGSAEKLTGMYTGQVVKRDDPLNLGRVKVRVKGLCEPESAWAFPMGGGSVNWGFFFVPKLNAEVAVWFRDGDIQLPYYRPANWGKNELPDHLDGDPDKAGFAFGPVRVIVDQVADGGRVKLYSTVNDGRNSIELDAVQNIITINAITDILIQATGRIKLDAMFIEIGGRVVDLSTKRMI